MKPDVSSRAVSSWLVALCFALTTVIAHLPLTEALARALQLSVGFVLVAGLLHYYLQPLRRQSLPNAGRIEPTAPHAHELTATPQVPPTPAPHFGPPAVVTPVSAPAAAPVLAEPSPWLHTPFPSAVREPTADIPHLETTATLEQVLVRAAELRALSARQRAMLEHAGSAIIATDTAGSITLFNPAAEAMLGYSAAEALGQNLCVLCHDAQEVRERAIELSHELGEPIGSGFEALAASTRLGGVDAREWLYVRRGGKRFPVLLSFSALRDDRNHCIGYLAMGVDVTERKSLEAELIKLNAALQERTQQAESANAAKSAFLANMSHEIRTPMNAVIGLNYLLGQTKLDAQQLSYVHKIQDASKLLLNVINDVLDLSKIEAGQLEVECAPFEIGKLLHDIHNLMAPSAAQKHLELRVELEPDLPPHAIGDVTRVKQILTNLVGNAIKFTERGKVSVSARCATLSGSRATLIFSVRDTGIGIPHGTLGELFKPFTQADASTTRKFGGTGLGLAIVSKLATLMGGEAGAHSTEGEGSEFWVRLPFEVDRRPVRGSLGSPQLQVLVASDDPAQRNRLSSMARGLGWRVDAFSWELQSLARRREAQHFDVVLFGWHKRELDPRPALRTLRAQLDGARAPVLMLVTAHEADACALGPDALVSATVPDEIGASGLFDAVNEALARDNGRSLGVARNATQSSKLADVRVLVVDDSEINLVIASRLLELHGANVATAQDGQEAIDMLCADPAAFDVVLMDVQMPRLDGNEATRRIRLRPELARMPIVAVTAGAMANERASVLESGMNAFISKPFDADVVVETLRGLVKRSRQAAAPANDARRPPLPTGWPLLAGINAHEVCARLGGDIVLFQSLLKRMLDEFDDAMIPRSAPPLAADRRELAQRLHKLFGVSGALGATRIANRAREIEKALRVEGSGELSAPLAQLAQELTRLRAAAGRVLSSAFPERPLSGAPERHADPEALAQLAEFLRAQDLEALPLFERLAAALRPRLGEASFGQLQAAIERLDFAAALSLLAAHEPLPERTRQRSALA